MEERKNILFGDIIVKDGKKKLKLYGCVFTEGDTHYKKKEIVEVLSFKIVGKTSITTGYTEVKSNILSKRDKMGGYE